MDPAGLEWLTKDEVALLTKDDILGPRRNFDDMEAMSELMAMKALHIPLLVGTIGTINTICAIGTEEHPAKHAAPLP